MSHNSVMIVIHTRAFRVECEIKPKFIHREHSKADHNIGRNCTEDLPGAQLCIRVRRMVKRFKVTELRERATVFEGNSKPEKSQLYMPSYPIARDD